MQEITSVDNSQALCNEGLGTTYERFVRRQYLRKLVHRFKIRLVLEAYCGTERADSLALADMGCKVVLMDKSKLNLKTIKSICGNVHSSGSVQFLHGDLQTLPLNSSAFDLVWNSDVITHFENPLKCVREMARVSKRLVLVFVPNRLHMGNLFFQLYLDITKPKPEIRYEYSMTVEALSRIFEKAGLGIVERGYIDAPLWPSHLSIGSLVKKKRRNWNMLDFASTSKLFHIQGILEESLSNSIKAVQAHIVYVLGKKPESKRPIDVFK